MIKTRGGNLAVCRKKLGACPMQWIVLNKGYPVNFPQRIRTLCLSSMKCQWAVKRD